MKFEIIEKGIVSGRINSFFSYCAWPSVCRDENNVMYVVTSGNRFAHVCPFGKILLFKSRDGGSTWSAPVIVCDHFLDDRDPGILYLGNGRILVTEFRHPAEVYANDYAECICNDSGTAGKGMLELYSSIDGDNSLGGAFMRVSDDYGETWSDYHRTPIHCPHGPILLNSGEIFYLGKEMYSCGVEKKNVIASYVSTDDGNSFIRTGEIVKPEKYAWNQFHEPHCVELENGRIIGVIRSHIEENDHYFTIYKSVSDDKGKTWSEMEPTGICGSPPHILKLKNGNMILVYARRAEPYAICARVMSPDGVISNTELTLDKADDSDIGYPASVELDDGSIVTVYYRRIISNKYCSIAFTKWKL